MQARLSAIFTSGLLLSSTLLAGPLVAQTTTSPVVSANASAKPRLTGIAHVAIRVADLERSRAFFEKLGYTQPFVLTGKNGEVTESFIKIGDRQFIELYPAKAGEAPAFLHVCFEAENLPGLYPTYAANGVDAPPVKKAGAGNLLMAWKGPEGQTEEITEYQPGSRHSNDFGQHLGPDRISTHLLGAVVPMRSPQATAQYFVQKMNFTDDGAREGAVITSPPGLRDAFFGFRASVSPEQAGASSEQLVMVFQVASTRKAMQRLKSLGLSAALDHGRILLHDPDGNGIVFTQQSL